MGALRDERTTIKAKDRAGSIIENKSTASSSAKSVLLYVKQRNIVNGLVRSPSGFMTTLKPFRSSSFVKGREHFNATFSSKSALEFKVVSRTRFNPHGETNALKIKLV
jgi:hypothetical protein